MKKLILLLGFLCFASLARAQIYSGSLTASDTGACTTANACVIATVANTQGGATFQLENTFSGTVQFEGLGGGSTWQALNATPSNSTTAATSATTKGIWQANIAGYTSIRIRCSTYASGTIVATITLSQNSARTGGGGGGGGGINAVAGTSPVVSDGGSPTATLSCPTCAIGPGSSTANHIAEFSGTDGITLKDGGPAGGLTVGTTTIASSTNGSLLYANSGVLGNETLASLLVSPPAIGGTTPAAGAFTTLSASSTVSGTGFSTYLASPPAIGGTAPAAGSFTTLSTTGTATIGGSTTGANFVCGTQASVVAGDIGFIFPTSCASNYGLYNWPLLPGSAGILHVGAASSNISALTSSLIVAADITNATITGTQLASSLALTTPNIGAATGTSLLVTGNLDGLVPVTLTTGTSAALGGTYKSGYTFNQEATAGAGVAYTLPTAAAGLQYCIANSYGGAADTGVLTLNTSASGQFIVFTDGTLTATGGNVTSGGAAADAACVVGLDSTHWQLYVQSGTWTKH